MNIANYHFKVLLPFGRYVKTMDLGAIARGTSGPIGHFAKYHNTPCLYPKILHKHCFQFLLGFTMIPRENKNKAYSKFGGTNKESYFPKWPIVRSFYLDYVTQAFGPEIASLERASLSVPRTGGKKKAPGHCNESSVYTGLSSSVV